MARRSPLPALSLCVVALGAGACASTVVGYGDSRDAGFDIDDASDAPDADDVSDADDAGDADDVPDLPEVPRVEEDCATPFDDDGDGLANEGCPCAPAGATQRCFERPGSLFNGMCRMGAQACGADGAWGACVGSWLPDAARRCQFSETFSDTAVSRRAVDIVWALDTSGSMTQETAYVNDNLNRFASVMAASGLDYRVVMVARRGAGSLRVCVPPPLGGPACADNARFRAVDQYVGSHDALTQIVSRHAGYRDFLRADSARFFVVVTDDESALAADEFDRRVRALGGFDGYVFHSIVGYESRADCPTMVARGSVYLTLTERTRGQRAKVCASDWSSIFTAFARDIVSRVTSWVLSQRPRVDTIQVWVTPPRGAERLLPTGWTYDPAMNRVTLSPDAIPEAGSTVRVVYRTAATSP